MLRTFFKANGGNASVVFVLVALPLCGAGVATIDLALATHQHSILQDAADAGALAGASRLSIASTSSATDNVSKVAEAAAYAQMADMPSAIDVTFVAETDLQKGAVKVLGVANRKPLVDLLKVAPTRLDVIAVAENLQKVPLCVLQSNTTELQLNNTAYLKAPGCAVHANGALRVASGAMVEAERIQSVGTASGTTIPRANAGAMSIPDPFASMDLTPPTECAGKADKVKVQESGTLLLPAGVHCEDYDIKNSARVILAAGEHYFMGRFDMKNNASLDGDDVVLFFGRDKAFSFADKGQVRLSARRSGKFAGFLIVTTRDNTAKFTIASDRVSELLGTIYIPNAQLIIETAGSVAQDSAWSVIVADTLTLKGDPLLVINHRYVGSGVPVPVGVGPTRKSPALTQ